MLLKAAKKGVKITIVSDNLANNSLNKEFINDSGLIINFKRNNKKFHDRYVIIDYKTEFVEMYHCGSSSKDSGNRITAINKENDKDRYYESIDIVLNMPNYIIE